MTCSKCRQNKCVCKKTGDDILGGAKKKRSILAPCFSTNNQRTRSNSCPPSFGVNNQNKLIDSDSDSGSDTEDEFVEYYDFLDEDLKIFIKNNDKGIVENVENLKEEIEKTKKLEKPNELYHFWEENFETSLAMVISALIQNVKGNPELLKYIIGERNSSGWTTIEWGIMLAKGKNAIFILKGGPYSIDFYSYIDLAYPILHVHPYRKKDKSIKEQMTLEELYNCKKSYPQIFPSGSDVELINLHKIPIHYLITPYTIKTKNSKILISNPTCLEDDEIKCDKDVGVIIFKISRVVKYKKNENINKCTLTIFNDTKEIVEADYCVDGVKMVGKFFPIKIKTKEPINIDIENWDMKSLPDEIYKIFIKSGNRVFHIRNSKTGGWAKIVIKSFKEKDGYITDIKYSVGQIGG